MKNRSITAGPVRYGGTDSPGSQRLPRCPTETLVHSTLEETEGDKDLRVWEEKEAKENNS